MNLVTIEVELDHGRVIAKGPEPLPDKASALLVLLRNNGAFVPKRDILERDPTLPRIIYYEDPSAPLDPEDWPEAFE